MPNALHWFRRDFRARDNTALYTAAADNDAVAGVFVIDPRWLGNPEKTGPFQAAFWLESLRELSRTLAGRNIPLVIRVDKDPVAAVLALARQISAGTITCNKDYEPDQITMDERLERAAARQGIAVLSYKDACVFEEQEILTGGSTVYSVFTPYKRAYLKRLADAPPEVRGLPRKCPNTPNIAATPVPAAESLGYRAVTLTPAPGEAAGAKLLARFTAGPIAAYLDQRDFPAVAGTSRLSAHLNAGTVSIRQAIAAARAAAPGASVDTFISELIWREFYRMILFNYPHTVSKPFAEGYGHVTWASNPAHLAAWAQARTGYPIVDAAMAQMLATGFMHNRLRMIAAMFLTKDLDCHWILGERFFMKSLIDYDQACNVGGWQWSASTGTDAAPYFRVMNPALQSARYDPDGAFIRAHIPALGNVPTEFIHAPSTMPAAVQRESRCIIGQDYPAPIVDHAVAKQAAIAKFRNTKPTKSEKNTK